MIIAEVFYGVKCDRCGEICDVSEHTYYMDESEAQEQALESEWGEKNAESHNLPAGSIAEVFKIVNTN